MTDPTVKAFLEVGSLMWLAGCHPLEVYRRAQQMKRRELRDAVLTGYANSAIKAAILKRKGVLV